MSKQYRSKCLMLSWFGHKSPNVQVVQTHELLSMRVLNVECVYTTNRALRIYNIIYKLRFIADFLGNISWQSLHVFLKLAEFVNLSAAHDRQKSGC